MDGVYYTQALPFGSEEWHETYSHDRNSMESMNDYIKNGPERLSSSTARRPRGLAAQSFLMTMLLTSANLRKIARYLRDKRRSKPKTTYPRRRDAEKLSTYVRWFDKPERVLWKDLDPELRQRE